MITHVCCNHIQARIDYMNAQLVRVKALTHFAPQTNREAFEDQATRMQKKLEVLKELLEHHKRLPRHTQSSLVEEA